MRNPAQLRRQVARGLPSIVRIFSQAHRKDAIEHRRNERLKGGNRRRVIFENCADDAGRRVTLERPSAGCHLINHGAQRPDVAACVGLPTLDLLGRHVVHGPENRPLRRLRRRRGHPRHPRHRDRPSLGPKLGQPEVQQLRPRLGQHDVGGLEITMDDSLAMRLVERVGDLGRDLQRLLERERPFLETRCQRLALQMRHDDKVRAIDAADVVDAADVRMVQRGDRTSFALETGPQFGIVGDLAGQDLDGDSAIEARIPCPIDLAHAAAPSSDRISYGPRRVLGVRAKCGVIIWAQGLGGGSVRLYVASGTTLVRHTCMRA